MSTSTPNPQPGRRTPEVSIVVPVYNEQENIVELYREIVAVMDRDDREYEVIFVDDGSRDESLQRICAATADDPRAQVIELMKNFGQTAAMAAGFAAARAPVIVPMDGDRQNDPADIPALVAKLDEGKGWDIVSGWRKNRHDKWFSRRLPSIIANRLVKRMTWTTEIHDFGCSLKAYRREVLDDVHLYGEMHRFLPAICKWRGARVTEVVVNHRPRTAGASKYGLKRTIKVLLDLLTVKFLGDYLTKPIYFFGKLAMGSMLVSFLVLGLAICQKYGWLLIEGSEPVRLNNSILVLFAMMTFLMSIMFLMIGVLAELLVRIYHEAQGRAPYKIRRIYTGTRPQTPPPAGDEADNGDEKDSPAYRIAR